MGNEPQSGMRKRWVGVALVILLTLTQLAAHDFWLASSPWIAQPGSTIVVTANVGDNTFPASQSFTSPERVESVRLLGAESTPIQPQFRKIGNSLAADLKLPSFPSTYLVVMSVKGRFLSMAPHEFEDYLKEEGLDGVLAERTRRGETEKPSRERYSRQAKVLVHAGDGVVDRILKPTGLAAELVPDSDFTRAHLGDAVGVRLLHEGKPVQHAQIALTPASIAPGESRVSLARTDRDGHALFKLAGNGPYLLATVVMVRRAGETGPEAADWESYWCSLTFDLAMATSLPQDKK